MPQTIRLQGTGARANIMSEYRATSSRNAERLRRDPQYGGTLMTEKSSQEDGVSRREFMVAAGAAAALGGTLVATGTPAFAAASANEICRMDAVTLAEKIRTKQLSATEVTEA